MIIAKIPPFCVNRKLVTVEYCGKISKEADL
jgi:hypothetical protein